MRTKAILTILVASLLGPVAPAWALCANEGQCSACKMPDGKPGERCCVNGRITPCTPVDTAAPTVSASGTVKVKYLVLTVVYSPPGTNGGKSSSSVEYGSGSTTGATLSSTSTFKQDYKVSVTTSAGILGSNVSAGLSFSYGQTSGNTSSMDVKKVATATIKYAGGATDGVDHQRDAIYLLLGPTLNVTINGKQLAWSLTSGGPPADIQYVLVHWMRDPSKLPPGVLAKLQQYGITPADYPEILKADPFAYGATAIDPNRFVQTPFTFPYEPPYAPNDTPPSLGFVIKNDATQGSSATSQSSYAVGVSASAEFNAVFAKVKVSTDNNWTWTSSSTAGSSMTGSESASVVIGGPAYGYTGPTDMAVYWDKIYKSFMFAPAPSPAVAVQGLVTSASGQPAAGREVSMQMGGVRYRTVTNARGRYRFVNVPGGAAELEVAGIKRPITIIKGAVAPKLDFKLGPQVIRPLVPSLPR